MNGAVAPGNAAAKSPLYCARGLQLAQGRVATLEPISTGFVKTVVSSGSGGQIGRRAEKKSSLKPIVVSSGVFRSKCGGCRGAPEYGSSEEAPIR